MSLVPNWAPDLHPLVIHFPIVLPITAVALDLVDAVFERPAWLGAAATNLSAAGAAAAADAYRGSPLRPGGQLASGGNAHR